MANITYHSPINKGAARIQLLINGAWVLNTEFTDDYAACSFADAQKAEAFAKAVISVPWKIQAWDGGDWNTVKRDARLAACNNCGADYNESAPEYAEQDRSRGNLCLKCQSNTELIVIYDPSEERSAESDEIFPIKDVIERINESWYWAYREFTNAEFQQYRDDIHSIESIPDNCPLSLEALQAATDKSMASLQAFWAKYRTILKRDDKFCAFPVTFALKLELIPQAGSSSTDAIG